MRPAVRLGLFAALLAAVFGVAMFVGSWSDPEPAGHEAAPDEGGHAGGKAEAHAVRGLESTQDGLTLALSARDLPLGRDAEIAFRITGEGGEVVRAFDVEHDREMHLIVVRRDGRGFQHLHPTMDADGTWRTPVTLGEPGAYRAFADFVTDGRRATLADTVEVPGSAEYAEFPEPGTSAKIDGYEVELESPEPTAGEEASLTFTVTRDGDPVELEPYLGAGGHLVALREEDLAYLHTHPESHGGGHGGHDAGPVFETTFPSAATYRLYFQFRHEGRVHTAEFTQEVSG